MWIVFDCMCSNLRVWCSSVFVVVMWRSVGEMRSKWESDRCRVVIRDISSLVLVLERVYIEICRCVLMFRCNRVGGWVIRRLVCGDCVELLFAPGCALFDLLQWIPKADAWH